MLKHVFLRRTEKYVVHIHVPSGLPGLSQDTAIR